MSVKNLEVPFSVSGRYAGYEPFTGIIELGFNERGGFVIAAWTTPPGEPRGRYFSSLAISPMSYRRKHGGATAYRKAAPGRIVLWDDWSNAHAIEAPPDVIDALVADCIANEVPENPLKESRHG